MSKKVGMLVAGYSGSVGTTIIAGLDLMSKAESPKLGMICESEGSDGATVGENLGVPPLNNVIVSGWDTHDVTVEEALRLNRVINETDLNRMSKSVLAQRPIIHRNGSTGFQYRLNNPG